MKIQPIANNMQYQAAAPKINRWTEPSYYSVQPYPKMCILETYERQPELLRLAKGAIAGGLGAGLGYTLAQAAIPGSAALAGSLGAIAGVAVGYGLWGHDQLVK